MVRTIGILGAGRVGSAIARTALKAGFEVGIAGSGSAEQIEMLVDIVVPGARAVSASDAVAGADLVVVAIPLHKYRSIPRELLAGRLVIDTMNYWPPVDGDLPDFEESTSSEVISDYFTGARVVKTLNHLGYHDLEIDARPAGHPERRALGIAGDSPADVAVVADVIERLGYDAVAIGPLRNGAALQPGQPIFGTPHNAPQLLDALPRLDADRALAAADRH